MRDIYKEMSESFHGMHEPVLEVKNGNKCILERINQLFPEEESDSFDYTRKCPLEDLYKALLDRVRDLEEKETQTKDALNTLRQQINDLQKSIYPTCAISNGNHQIKGSNEAEYVITLDSTVSNTLQTKQTVNKDSDNDTDASVVKLDTDGKDTSATKQQETDTNNADEPNIKSNSEMNNTSPLQQQEDAIENNALASTDVNPDATTNNDHVSSSVEPNKENMVSDNTNTSKLPLETTLEQTAYSTETTAEEKRAVVVMDKPNFTKRSAVQKTGVKLVEQTEPKYHQSNMTWDMTATEEHMAGRNMLKNINGIHNVLCIDISASMAEGDAWVQARTFFADYISGLEDIANEYDLKHDNVALVTFGHETKVVHRLTKDFRMIRQAFDTIKLGGPTPMYGGLAMSIAAAQTSCSQAVVNGTEMLRKIILITDGEPTDGNMYAGPDVGDINSLAETKLALQGQVARLQSNNMELLSEMQTRHKLGTIFIMEIRQKTVLQEFLQLLASQANGTVVDFKGGRKLSKRLLDTVSSSQGSLPGMLSLDSLLGSSGSMLGSSSGDLEKMLKKMKKHSKSREEMQYHEGYSDTLPPIGSRVARGPDWSYPNQDSHGLGTIIGNNPPCNQIWIEWDADEDRNVYSYGCQGEYDVLITDAPRVIPRGRKIAVGCVVKIGPHWKGGQMKEYTDVKGVVIKVMSDEKKVQVRWNNRERGDYSYGEDGVYEVELSQKSSPDMTDYACGHPVEKVPLKKKNKKNKNSNVGLAP